MKLKSLPIGLSLLALAAFPTLGRQAASATAPPKSHAELTDYRETSRYDDVIKFFNDLQPLSPLMRQTNFGTTFEGRAMPLVILADPPIATPAQARASGKPVVFIMANIHAGEVEGKEAMQSISRRILFGDLKPLLRQIVILIAPDYNADGNEKINVRNRTDQFGPVGGVGVRENSQGFDLNRDYIKLEAPETRALVKLMNDWDPNLTVDLHTTDGSYHAYHLTYSIPLNPSIDPALMAYHREKMMPEIEKAMLDKHKYRTYYYGNFAPTGARSEQSADPKAWYAFSQQPRVGQNYVGFRNRLTILSEAYSHLDFRKRVEVTEAFVEEIFKYSAAHANEIMAVTKAADENTIKRMRADVRPTIGVEYEQRPLPDPVTILVGAVTNVPNPLSGANMVAMVEDKVMPVKMPDYGIFVATRSIPVPRAYVFGSADVTKGVIEKLQEHGIKLEQVIAPLHLGPHLASTPELFMISTNAQKSQRRFQGHSEVKLSGHYQPLAISEGFGGGQSMSVDLPAGAILVRTDQPLGLLAAYLLEPESDDGLVTWNFMDKAMEHSEHIYPVFRLLGKFTEPTRPLQAP